MRATPAVSVRSWLAPVWLALGGQVSVLQEGHNQPFTAQSQELRIVRVQIEDDAATITGAATKRDGAGVARNDRFEGQRLWVGLAPSVRSPIIPFIPSAS
ncbi:MAG: hypothetical protein ACTHMA_15180 [Thermomicrobiales bacterium]